MKYILTIISISISLISYCQSIKSKKYTFKIKTELDAAKANDFGAFLDDEVEEIHLVSLEPACTRVTDGHDSLQTEIIKYRCHFTSIIDEDSVDQSRFKTTVDLRKGDVYDLLNAIYKPKLETEIGACYEPRHGVAFYNDQQELIGFIEICFTCAQMRVFGKCPHPGLMAYEDFMMIENIYKLYMQDYFEED